MKDSVTEYLRAQRKAAEMAAIKEAQQVAKRKNRRENRELRRFILFFHRFETRVFDYELPGMIS